MFLCGVYIFPPTLQSLAGQVDWKLPVGVNVVVCLCVVSPVIDSRLVQGVPARVLLMHAG